MFNSLYAIASSYNLLVFTHLSNDEILDVGFMVETLTNNFTLMAMEVTYVKGCLFYFIF